MHATHIISAPPPSSSSHPSPSGRLQTLLRLQGGQDLRIHGLIFQSHGDHVQPIAERLVVHGRQTPGTCQKFGANMRKHIDRLVVEPCHSEQISVDWDDYSQYMKQ